MAERQSTAPSKRGKGDSGQNAGKGKAPQPTPRPPLPPPTVVATSTPRNDLPLNRIRMETPPVVSQQVSSPPIGGIASDANGRLPTPDFTPTFVGNALNYDQSSREVSYDDEFSMEENLREEREEGQINDEDEFYNEFENAEDEGENIVEKVRHLIRAASQILDIAPPDSFEYYGHNIQIGADGFPLYDPTHYQSDQESFDSGHVNIFYSSDEDVTPPQDFSYGEQ